MIIASAATPMGAMDKLLSLIAVYNVLANQPRYVEAV